MAVGSGSKQPPISRPTCSGGSSSSNSSNSGNGPIMQNGLNGSSNGLVLSSLLAPTSVSNGLAQSIATLANNVTSGGSGGSTSPTNHMINGIQGGQGGNSLKGFMMERQQQQQQQYLSELTSPLPNLCVNSSLSQVRILSVFNHILNRQLINVSSKGFKFKMHS